MDERYAIARYEQAALLLPPRWQRLARQLPDHQKARAEELRLRAGQPMTVLLPEGEVWPSGEQPVPRVAQADLEQLCDMVTGYSRYAVSDTMAQGYLTAPGGFRVGLGKTTLLRDMIRALSDGSPEHAARRVAVVDERGEIAGVHRGVPQLAVGCHTDVLDGCPKALGIPMLLRSANPQIIAVDEITVREDLAAISAAANCGVTLLATIHAADAAELKRKPLFAQLLRLRVFEKAVTITRREGRRLYEVTAL